ncbi:P1 family peptidase [Nocardioides halotolerans]|uniref:P1 family peptidase n=1 Tax=Nocardioides halotolerans TaxID=433660 RepID=UPI0004227D7B|nr:P1 family peptidase [Nocardioides halotolerans]
MSDARARARDLGIAIGALPTGPTNSVLDVEGVGLGHVTITRDTARTGVTCLYLADDTYPRPLVGGGAVLNGLGDCTGFLPLQESGLFESPVWLTSTSQVGRVFDAAFQLELGRHPDIADDIFVPVVAECDDSFLNDVRTMWVQPEDVRAAHEAALASRGSTSPPDEGSVGSGTGMSCLGFKGGIGTSSRVAPGGHTVAVLLMTNFGQRSRLTVDGVPVGRLLPAPVAPPQRQPPPAGSCIGVVVTDAPVDPLGCQRLAARVGLGLARTGSTAHHGSGEIFLAASTTARTDRDLTALDTGPRLAGRALDDLFEAVVDSAEEAVLNSLLMSPTTVGRGGNTSEGLDPDTVVRLLREHGRLGDPA